MWEKKKKKKLSDDDEQKTKKNMKNLWINVTPACVNTQIKKNKFTTRTYIGQRNILSASWAYRNNVPNASPNLDGTVITCHMNFSSSIALIRSHKITKLNENGWYGCHFCVYERKSEQKPNQCASKTFKAFLSAVVAVAEIFSFRSSSFFLKFYFYSNDEWTLVYQTMPSNKFPVTHSIYTTCNSKA